MCTWRQDCKEKKALPNLIYEITIFVKVKITTRIKNHERNWHANRESQKVKLNIISAKRIKQEFMKNVDLNCQTKDNGGTFPRSLLPKACVNSFFSLGFPNTRQNIPMEYLRTKEEYSQVTPSNEAMFFKIFFVIDFTSGTYFFFWGLN